MVGVPHWGHTGVSRIRINPNENVTQRVMQSKDNITEPSLPSLSLMVGPGYGGSDPLQSGWVLAHLGSILDE